MKEHMNTELTEKSGHRYNAVLVIGDKVELSVTGCLGRHFAKLVSVNKNGQGHFEITDEPGWPILKPGDYILHEVAK